MSAEVTTLGRLAISPIVASNGSLAAANLLLNHSGWTKGFNENVADGNALRGTLDGFPNRVRTTHYSVSPRLEMEPTALELARILDWALGTAPSGTAYTLGNDTRKAFMQYDDNTTVWDYNEVAVNTLSIRCSEQDPILKVSLGLLGKKCTPGGTFAAGLASAFVDATTTPFTHADTTISDVSQVVVNSAATMVSAIEIDIDNHLAPDRFFNSQYLTGFVKTDRTINVRLTYPFGEYVSLYAAAATEGAGIPTAITWTAGLTSLLATLPAVLYPRTPIEIQGKTEVMHQISGTAYRTAATAALAFTLDSTP